MTLLSKRLLCKRFDVLIVVILTSYIGTMDDCENSSISSNLERWKLSWQMNIERIEFWIIMNGSGTIVLVHDAAY